MDQLALLSVFLVLPSALSWAVFRFFFPKHVLQWKGLVGIPLVVSISFFVFLILVLIFGDSQLVKDHGGLAFGVVSFLSGSIQNVILGLLTPSLIVGLVSWGLKIGWQRQLPILQDVVDRLIHNPTARLTKADLSRELLMLDVLDKDGQLYTGVFQEYFLEDNKLAGIAMSNCMRYARKEPLSTVRNRYIIPNQGILFFPKEIIVNLHFWHLRFDGPIRVDVSNEEDGVNVAWLLSLEWGRQGSPFEIDLNQSNLAANGGGEADSRKLDDAFAERVLKELDKLHLKEKILHVNSGIPEDGRAKSPPTSVS